MEHTIEYDVVYQAFTACFGDDVTILLGAETLEEAEAEIKFIMTEGV
jgi:hypothetical protein